MKATILILAIFLSLGIRAQDTVRVKMLGKNLVTVTDLEDKTDVKIGRSIDIHDNDSDTVRIRVGRKTIVIAEGHHRNSVRYSKLNDEEYKQLTGDKPKFKGHWSFLEMGVNSFANTNYSGYSIPNFMDLNHNKSLEVNINFLKYSIGLQKENTSIGMVTGLGLNFNDYRFSNDYTIKNDNGYIVPVAISDSHLEKTKLSTGFLTVPLLLEFQLPKETGLWCSVGVIGGLKIGSHTKVRIAEKKYKDRGDFNINPFRGGVTARVGYKGLNIFSTCYLTPLFRDHRGPELTPFTIGIGWVNL